MIFKKNAFENAKDVRESYIKHFIEKNEQNKSKKEQNLLLKSVINYISGGETNDYSTLLIKMYPIIAFWKAFNDNRDTIEKGQGFSPCLFRLLAKNV